MSARYLIRLDDACDTMDRRRWSLVEQVLDKHAVKPIVAVIPDNQDRSLMFEPRNAAFWDKVRAWAQKDWSVAMHGYTHVMHPTQSKLVLPFYTRSEFAGLALEAQAQKIRAAWTLFLAHGVEPKIWVAPAHCFDLITLQAIHQETSIRVVSDGIAWDTYFEHDFHWVPQQLWSLSERKSGLWTVCLHPNTMDGSAIEALDSALGGKFRGRLTCFHDVDLRKRKKSILGRLYNGYFWWRRKQLRSALLDH
jgi:predicted deacetylase